jgi:hypothetical protein
VLLIDAKNYSAPLRASAGTGNLSSRRLRRLDTGRLQDDLTQTNRDELPSRQH